MDWIVIANEIEPHLRKNELEYCIKRVTSILKTLAQSPYHLVLDLDFTNDPKDVAAYFDQFVQIKVEHSNLKTLYTETNGFYINPHRWYFEIFGYRTYGGHHDYDWLSQWDYMSEHDLTLIGMETLQAVYQHHLATNYWQVLDYGGNPQVEQVRIARDLCDLMIVLRFQNLIQRSVTFMKSVRVPILITSHDYAFIYEITPSVQI